MHKNTSDAYVTKASDGWPITSSRSRTRHFLSAYISASLDNFAVKSRTAPSCSMWSAFKVAFTSLSWLNESLI